jgi:hypothetical protein
MGNDGERGIYRGKIDTFIHISKGGFFISSTNNAFFEDEQGPIKTKIEISNQFVADYERVFSFVV